MAQDVQPTGAAGESPRVSIRQGPQVPERTQSRPSGPSPESLPDACRWQTSKVAIKVLSRVPKSFSFTLSRTPVPPDLVGPSGFVNERVAVLLQIIDAIVSAAFEIRWTEPVMP